MPPDQIKEAAIEVVARRLYYSDMAGINDIEAWEEISISAKKSFFLYAHSLIEAYEAALTVT